MNFIANQRNSARLSSGGKVQELANPTVLNGDFIKELQRLVTPKAEGAVSRPSELESEFHRKILDLLGSTTTGPAADAEKCEIMFNKLRKDPVARARLENIHSARAHRYGAAHLGSKFWYRESQAISKKLKSQADRRKFRQGLRADLDFINQLNFLDLEDVFNLGKDEALNLLKLDEPLLPSELFKSLKDVPPLKIIRLINSATAEKIVGCLKKISDLAHFSQSMADYFAHDDALEPALAVLCEVLRNAPNIGTVLSNKCQTFLGLATGFQKLRSSEDHDIEKSDISGQQAGKTAKKTRQPRSRRSLRFRPGVCFQFQGPNGCQRDDCQYSHICDQCNSEDHGKSQCPNNRR